jgi:hypothetical protein
MDEQAVRAALQHYVVELPLRYNGGPWKYGVDILEFRDDKVVRETAYSMDAWEAPHPAAIPPWRPVTGMRRVRPGAG